MKPNPRLLGAVFAVLVLAISPSSVPSGSYHVVLSAGVPRQVRVTDGLGRLLATFTYGARTVLLPGKPRTFFEASAGAPVVSSVRVRLLPQPFSGEPSMEWVRAAGRDTSPDVLDVAAQYLQGAPPVLDANGLRIAGAAGYGEEDSDGWPQPGADFNDFLGVPWTFGTEKRWPEPQMLGDLDCSGYMRMVFGYREGLPLGLAPAENVLPRKSYQIYESGPGVVTSRSDSQVTDFRNLQPGDLVFFDAKNDPRNRIDHVGMFLGTDTDGGYRFISSRRTANGPSMGDDGGKSLLDGTGLYAKAFRGIRRL